MSGVTRSELVRGIAPAQIRHHIRVGEWREHTIGLAEGYVQANLVILPRHQAFDFLTFCQRNPQPCPVLEITDPGDPRVKIMASASDLRTDLGRYRVFRDGECVDEPADITKYWRDDLVGFLLGCSASFEYSLISAKIRLRHIEQGKVAPTYVTNIKTYPAGPFSGPMAVTMRAISAVQASRAVQITSRYPAAHGRPVYMGDPAKIGIKDVTRPLYGEWVGLEEGEVAMFWACGITPQIVALQARPEFMITHYPGHMFISDKSSEEMAAF